MLQSVIDQTSLFAGINSSTVKSKKESPLIFTINLSFCFSELPVNVIPHHSGTLLIFLIASLAPIFTEILLLKLFFSISFTFLAARYVFLTYILLPPNFSSHSDLLYE
ncbi:hypothetical protein LEP1GSC047_4163 [Leptospira inadai serovar Lyme str. 10]|uniref:Uncharacterized protein n=1 Tax=Leptospira inadai serovar Lyme str. 10 TaxID=1049790 RepID=V6HCD5_9LEPT|nr:hypothetical protein LEP1GSC047_4163 [Leptospira inadai serovar Lyme str. 10]